MTGSIRKGPGIPCATRTKNHGEPSVRLEYQSGHNSRSLELRKAT
jgi:hypothetical protein